MTMNNKSSHFNHEIFVLSSYIYSLSDYVE